MFLHTNMKLRGHFRNEIDLYINTQEHSLNIKFMYDPITFKYFVIFKTFQTINRCFMANIDTLVASKIASLKSCSSVMIRDIRSNDAYH